VLIKNPDEFLGSQKEQE